MVHRTFSNLNLEIFILLYLTEYFRCNFMRKASNDNASIQILYSNDTPFEIGMQKSNKNFKLLSDIECELWKNMCKDLIIPI